MRGKRRADARALNFIAGRSPQEGKLVFIFDAFRDDRQIQRVSQIDDGLGQLP